MACLAVVMTVPAFWQAVSHELPPYFGWAGGWQGLLLVPGTLFGFVSPIAMIWDAWIRKRRGARAWSLIALAGPMVAVAWLGIWIETQWYILLASL